MSQNIKVVGETAQYRVIVMDHKGQNRYFVHNTEFDVIELDTSVLPEAYTFMEKAQQFYNTNIVPSKKTKIIHD